MRAKEAILAVFFLILLSSVLVSAAGDVAYLYKKSYKIDQNIIDIFESLGLTVDLIQEEAQPSNYNSYRFLFVGDENFKKNIPVNNYPSIVSSYYHADTWGLTDNEGVSQLGATHPLSVLVDGHTFQVYTEAMDQSRVAIPYYYLDKENKALAMEQVAGTETTSSGYKFGDVISYAYPNSVMMNGKTQQGKLCFYGIIESDFWTQNAKDLFEDCVEFVASECSMDSDCGGEETSEPFCKNNDVYKTKSKWTCENPGTALSQCVEDEDDELVEDCEDICVNAECVDIECFNDEDCGDNNQSTKDTCLNPGTQQSECIHEPIECFANSDCGIDGFINEPVCSNLDIVQDYKAFTCSNPGTPQSSCSSSITQKLVETCSEACLNGECKSIICSQDSQCGTDGLVGEKFCQGKDVYQDFKEFSCLLPGTLQSSCTDNTTPQLIEACAEACFEGECVSITCFQDSDCGEKTEFGEAYCSAKNITQDFIVYDCLNPGTPQSECKQSISTETQETCSDLCINGECKEIECNEDEECNDFTPLTLDRCVNPGTIISECQNIPLNCASDADCGFTGFIGEEYCSLNNDVYKNYQTVVCHNPGTLNSFCEIDASPELINECSDVCLEGACITCITNSDCSDNNSTTEDVCINPATPQSYCQNTPIQITCSQNSDCGTNGLIGEPICSGLNITQNFKSFTCLNPGTPQSSCTSSTTPQVQETCSEACVNAECVSITCDANLDCGTNTFTGKEFCVGDGVYKNFKEHLCLLPGTPQSSCEIDTNQVKLKDCQYACFDGACIRCDQNQDCNDNNTLTQDICKKPGTVESYCQNTPIQITCSKNSDCGTNGLIGEPVCSGLNITQNFKSFTCLNPGTPQSSCTSSTTPQVQETCSEACVNAECVSITCDANLDCGEDGFIGNDFCSQNDVYKNYKSFTCLNPGTPQSSCTSSTSPILQEECSDFCVNGQCIDITCSTDEDCDDSDSLTFDQCLNPGTPQSFCRNTEINCAQNNDCGFTGFLGEEFCGLNDNVYKNYQESLCIAPSTLDSYCSQEVAPELIDECDYACTDGICVRCDQNQDCNDSNPLTTDVCKNPDTVESYCQNTPVPIPCSKNLDCGIDGFVTEPVCFGLNITGDYKTYTCNNKGTPQSYCSSSTQKIVQETCDETCVNAECVDITCYENEDCGIDGYLGELFCSEDDKDVMQIFQSFTCLSPGTPQSECKADLNEETKEECEDICIDGQCEEIICYKDNDCDDSKDNTKDVCINPGTSESYCNNIPLDCTPGDVRDCGVSDIGICQLGSQICTSAGVWDKCVGAVNPEEEICEDELDNDCDGIVNEDCEVCENQCLDGQRRCALLHKGYQVCGDFNDDGCTEWSETKVCGLGRICIAGFCICR